MAYSVIRKLSEVARSVTYTVCAVHIVTNYVVDATLTKGPSMSPVISDRGALVLYLQPPMLRILRGNRNQPYREGDIVISVSPTNASKRICKRICNKEPERNGIVSLPEGYVWIEGDNKSNSLDSRHYGAISSHLLLGRVFLAISLQRGIEVL